MILLDRLFGGRQAWTDLLDPSTSAVTALQTVPGQHW
jgi:hypothetical protein